MCPKLGYWNIRGLAQPIRFLLKYLGVEYEEKIYNHYLGENGEILGIESWFDEKFKLGLDFPNVPYWIDGDVKITETTAIMNHLCRKYNRNLLGGNDEECDKIDMLNGVIWDTARLLDNYAYINTEDCINSYNERAPQKIKQLANFLGGKKFFLGDQIKVIDFLIYELLYHHKVFRPEIITIHPNLKEFFATFENLPSIQAYLKTGEIESHYPKIYSLPSKIKI